MLQTVTLLAVSSKFRERPTNDRLPTKVEKNFGNRRSGILRAGKMIMTKNSQIFGKGSAHSSLDNTELRKIVENAIDDIQSNARVLAIIPDASRDDNTHILFPFADEFLRSKGFAKFDALVAQGTHPPISDNQKLEKIGLQNFTGNIFNHEWNNPENLTRIGGFSSEEVSEMTTGAFARAVDLAVNKLILDYDLILVFGATVPHEVAGFSGGAKYFFPGISGADLTNATHWIGALAGIENIIGQIETPTRFLIEKAADFIQAEIINFTSVVSRNNQNLLQTHALFAGDFREIFRKSAAISRQIHIKFVDKKFKKVLAILDEHYTELWTGGKASYKLGGIIEDGGELVIYAPHLTRISETHGAFIEKYGYAPIEKIKELAANSEELQKNLCVAAHLAHVSYCGNCDNLKMPKYKITLATQIPEEICRKVNLQFADYKKLDLADFTGDPDILIVENAGRDLYLLKENSNN